MWPSFAVERTRAWKTLHDASSTNPWPVKNACSPAESAAARYSALVAPDGPVAPSLPAGPVGPSAQ